MSAICYIWAINQADVAQLDRAFGYEPKGSRFESWHPQKKGDLRQASRLFLFDRNQARNWSRRNSIPPPYNKKNTNFYFKYNFRTFAKTLILCGFQRDFAPSR